MYGIHFTVKDRAIIFFVGLAGIGLKLFPWASLGITVAQDYTSILNWFFIVGLVLVLFGIAGDKLINFVGPY